MAKVALLIGVSEYEPGLNPLPASVKDMQAIAKVLQHPEMGGFAEADIQKLENPDPQKMQEAIETLFSDRRKDDLAIVYFSGHGIKDESGKLYLATRLTRKNLQGQLIKSTAVPASFIHNIMSDSRCKRQVVILDCCFSGAFAEEWSAKDDDSVDIRAELGGEGRVVLTSSTSTQYSFQQEGENLSIYTRYLIEGIETGVADLDNDGAISVDELHEYAKKKVKEAAPAMQPEIYAVKEGFKIILAKAAIGDPKLKYRKEVEIYASRGVISNIGRKILDTLRQNLGLLPEEVAAIETEVLKPYREYQQKLQEYEKVLIDALSHEETLSESTRNELRRYKEILGLRNQDIAPIEAKIIPQKQSTSTEFLRRNLTLEDKLNNNQQSAPNYNLNFRNIAQIKNKLLVGLAGLIFGLASVQIIYSQITSLNPRYVQLQKLLSDGKWKEADDETAQKMWEVAGRQEERSLTEEDFEKFPCEDLQTIDNLWVKYSKKHFGFSVQKHIWQSPDVNSDFDKFIARIGWSMSYDNKIIFKRLNLLNFDLTAPKGQLPVAVTYNGGNVITCKKYMSRIISCDIGGN
ncbi:caspase, EACC1-associated type [Nostoc sp.]|uniref:caspase, EACC1-associated type n=1 Tax=Nostoc sp. TaxID=1180 RepID=UPI002FFBF6E1